MASTALVDEVDGPVFFVAFVQALSQGILLCQYARYIGRNRRDTRVLRVFAGWIILASVVQTALEVYKAWYIFGQKEAWSMSPLEWSEFLLNQVICATVQGFLIHRCYKITRTWMTPIPLILLLLVPFSGVLWLTITVFSPLGLLNMQEYNLAYIAWFLPRVEAVFGCVIVGSTVLDLSITAILLVYFFRFRRGLRASGAIDDVLRTVINVTWESAALPMACMILATIMFILQNYSIAAVCITLTGKLYSHGLLRTLNLRPTLRHQLSHAQLRGMTIGLWDLEQTLPTTVSLEHVSTVPDFVNMEHISEAPPKRRRASFASSVVTGDDSASAAELPAFTPYHSRPDPVKDVEMHDAIGATMRSSSQIMVASNSSRI